jgi:hypothetical protein
MIPAIGIMIGAYCFARIVELLSQDAHDRIPGVYKFFTVTAIISLLVTTICCLVLVFSGTPSIPGMP